MKNLYLHEDCIISPIGYTTSENLEHLRSGTTGLQKFDKSEFLDTPICAGVLNSEVLAQAFSAIGDSKAYCP